MDMKFLIIPDVHGKEFWRYAEKHIEEYDHIIFLGDYLDAWDSEGITNPMMLYNLKEIIRFRELEFEKIILLWGNHELSYFDSTFLCSGYRPTMANEARMILMENRKYFQIAYQFKDLLFTHAGITNGWYKEHKDLITELTPEDEFDTSEWLAIALNRMFDSKYFRNYAETGHIRGGYYKYGSHVLADMQETATGGTLHEFHQIVGHTPQESKQPKLKRFPKHNSSILFCDIGKPIEITLNGSKGSYLYRIIEDGEIY